MAEFPNNNFKQFPNLEIITANLINWKTHTHTCIIYPLCRFSIQTNLHTCSGCDSITTTILHVGLLLHSKSLSFFLQI
ncbi:hypothetical protein L6452_39602 [Arctium lappa]|uniref:Uncharacterized protein n=1 Tax=Arctium lappa TaxID=4217 RepID=A0ACB8XSS2_ARCLA|nr:hypothetical protein L6452_39602 [Arctium lappa]